MKRKIATLMLLAMFLIPFSLVKAEENEYMTWGYVHGGIKIQCFAPIEAYPGDTLTIKVRIEVYETIRDFYLWIIIFGIEEFDEAINDYVIWSSDYLTLNYVELSSGVIRNEEFKVQTPFELEPGMVWGFFDVWWCDKYGGWWYLPPYGTVAFTVTTLKDKTFEDLQKAYNELLARYEDLLNNYDTLNLTYYSLLNEYNELLDEHEGLRSDYEDLQNTYNTLASSYENLLSNYTSLKSNYLALNITHNSLKANHTSLQSSFNSLQTNYDLLETTYTSLNSTYNSLKADYDEMKAINNAKTNELNITRNLSYILAVATIIFITTSIILATRKAKVKT